MAFKGLLNSLNLLQQMFTLSRSQVIKENSCNNALSDVYDNYSRSLLQFENPQIILRISRSRHSEVSSVYLLSVLIQRFVKQRETPCGLQNRNHKI